MDNLIRENRDNDYISYILEDDQLFYEIGYKVLLSQEKNGFVKCVKVSHNGKIKLVYDISRFKTLQSLVEQMTPENFLSVIYKLFLVTGEVKNNGFMQYENIDVSISKIFVDKKDLKPYLLYLPINIQTDQNSILAFEKKLKANTSDEISKNPNLYSADVAKLYTILKSSNYTIEAILDNLRNRENMDEQMQPYPTHVLNTQPGYQHPANSGNPNQFSYVKQQSENQVDTKEPNTSANKGSIKSVLNGIFAFKKKEEVQEEAFKPVALIGVNTPVKVDIVISKPEFTIGTNPEAVDGVVKFNKAISRVHCKITWIDSIYYICDLGSLNGTHVNFTRLPQDTPVPIKIGDKINLADSEFVIKSMDL